jgi:hypothetical protein
VWWTFLCAFFLAGSFFFLATGFFAAAVLAWVAVVWGAPVPPQPATASATIPINPINSVRLIDIPFS